MTQEEKRIKLAEAAGWKPDDDGAGLNTWEASYCGSRLYGLKPRFGAEGIVVSYIVDCLVPDYFNDLNAVHDLENVLNDEQARTYAYALYDLANGFQFDGDPWTPDIFEASMGGVVDMVRATAAQRADAIGLALNLW